MAQPSQLSPSLIQKGDAKPVSPEVASGAQAPQPAAQKPLPPPPASIAQPEVEPTLAASVLDDLAMPDTIPRTLISFRAPVQLTEELRLMAFETRRPKQDLLTEFLSEGLKRWKAARARRVR
jgi:hypothetical protein